MGRRRRRRWPDPPPGWPGWRAVRAAARRVLVSQPWLRETWDREGLRRGFKMRAMVRGELAKGVRS